MRDRRVAVVGLAREGEALTHYLVRQACHVVATDLRSPASFGDRLRPLADAGVELVLGGHPPSLLDGCELVFVSPGVPFDSALLNEARARGIPLSAESRLFCQMCPAPITAVTGSSGKTTTISLIGEMLRADQRVTSQRHAGVWVGGNIGQPLIASLDQIQAGDQVVMELSSFQLEYFHPSANAHVRSADTRWLPLLCGWSPAVGAILNITPNHLDRHASMEAYAHAKQAIVAYRRPWDVAVLGQDNPVTRTVGEQLRGDVRWFSRRSMVDRGACLSDEAYQATVMLRRTSAVTRRDEESVCRVGDIQLRGEHNVENVLAACAIADALGVSVEAMRQVCTTFAGVSHRLEWVGEVDGVHYYNDSIATSPERMVAALRSFDEPIVLLAGGRDKHLPWEQAAQLILKHTRHVILFGEAAGLIAGALTAASARERDVQDSGQPPIHRCGTLEDAVAVAACVANPGDVVLLSPGCTSFDSFTDFAERGERFRQLVGRMKARSKCADGVER
jgi:UDP-N-acetylmuramoylalanine--D-glutamate ligase